MYRQWRIEKSELRGSQSDKTLNINMPQYRLTYFNAAALGELPRWIFAYAGQDYVDERIERADWPELKPKTPFGQLPVLHVDNDQIGQSLAIARYLAKQFGLAGKTALERARADMLIDCLNDARQPVMGIFLEKDEAKKEALLTKFKEEQLPFSLEKFEGFLKSNNGGDGYFVGDSVTWADFAMAMASDPPARVGVTVDYDKYPKLKAHKARILAIPQIADWIKKRPQT